MRKLCYSNKFFHPVRFTQMEKTPVRSEQACICETFNVLQMRSCSQEKAIYVSVVFRNIA